MTDIDRKKYELMLSETESYINKNVLVDMIKVSAEVLDPDTKRVTIDMPIDYLAGNRLDFFDDYIITALSYMVEDLEFLEHLKNRRTEIKEILKEGVN